MIEQTPHLLDELVLTEVENKEIRDFYIYFLWFEEKIVYIGKTCNLSARTKAHKKDKMFDKVTFRFYPQTSNTDILVIERANIDFYTPLFNDDTKTIIKAPTYCYIRSAGTGRYFEKGKFYSDKLEKCYYNGDVHVRYVVRLYTIEKFVDNVHKGTLQLKDIDYEFVINNSVLSVKITNRKEKYGYRAPADAKTEYPVSYYVFTKGKYKGKKYEDVAKKDAGYVAWIKQNVPNYKKELMTLKHRSVNKRESKETEGQSARIKFEQIFGN